MDFTGLEQNICDVLYEQQLKLGYRKEVVRLFYPLLSLNRFLKTDMGIADMINALKEFCNIEENKLGRIEVSNEGERFCFLLSEEISEYIHENAKKGGFLNDFIDTVSKHGATIDEVIAVFKKYSDHVHVENTAHGEFDYLVYFEDGHPDSFRYCLTDEGCHIIYHRFTIEDYMDFGFEQ